MQTVSVDRPYTVKEFAEASRLSLNAVYEMIRRGELPAVHLGRSIRLPRKVCDQILEGRST
jgi:excisionase family DNA binding protein